MPLKKLKKTLKTTKPKLKKFRKGAMKLGSNIDYYFRTDAKNARKFRRNIEDNLF